MKRKMILVLLGAALLVGGLTTAFTGLPAPIAEPFSEPSALVCAMTKYAADKIDIPSRRVDYQILDRLSDCEKVADLKLVPVTAGEPKEMDGQFQRFKENQAQERMGPASPGAVDNAGGQVVEDSKPVFCLESEPDPDVREIIRVWGTVYAVECEK